MDFKALYNNAEALQNPKFMIFCIFQERKAQFLQEFNKEAQQWILQGLD